MPSTDLALYGAQDLELMAKRVSESRLFPGIATPQAAFTLMLLCQAEGLHPATALKRYHIIDNKPSMRADAMLAEFQRQGGKVRWIDRSDDAVSAEFSHPSGGTITVKWDIAQAKRAGLAGKKNWQSFPRQMLTARVISEGVRTILPGVVAGIYTPEEVQDFDPPPGRTIEVEARPVEPEAIEPPRRDVEPWAALLARAVRTANDDWRNDCRVFAIEAEGDLTNQDRAINHLVSAAVAAGFIPESATTKSNAKGATVRDDAKAKAELLKLYNAYPAKVKASLEKYLASMLAEARQSAGISQDVQHDPAEASQEPDQDRGDAWEGEGSPMASEALAN